MTNIFKTPVKTDLKARLFDAAVQALEKDAWRVERVRGSGKSSVRRIIKGSINKVISIRTTQDTWIAFPRTEGDKGWRTLDEVDLVVPVSVDDPANPKFAKVHMIDGDEMRDRFNRAYAARLKAGYSIPIGRGVWVSLYLPEAKDPVTHVGAGAGLKFPPFASVPLDADTSENVATDAERPVQADSPLTIAEAKRRLAITFGVEPANIKITVEA